MELLSQRRFKRYIMRDKKGNIYQWYDTNLCWGVSRYDEFNRQIYYADYSGYERKIKYEENGDIIWFTNQGVNFHFIKNLNKSGYKVIREIK